MVKYVGVAYKPEIIVEAWLWPPVPSPASAASGGLWR